MGRPRKYATDAERQKAFRERRDRATQSGALVAMRVMPIRVTEKDHETLVKLAEEFDISINELMFDLVGWALANRNWGAFTRFRRLPRAPNPEELFSDDGPMENPTVYRVEIASGARGDSWRVASRHKTMTDAKAAAIAWARGHPLDTVRVVK